MTTPFVIGTSTTATLCCSTYSCSTPNLINNPSGTPPLLFPNPANDVLQIVLPESINGADIALYSLKGDCLLKQNWTKGG